MKARHFFFALLAFGVCLTSVTEAQRTRKPQRSGQERPQLTEEQKQQWQAAHQERMGEQDPRGEGVRQGRRGGRMNGPEDPFAALELNDVQKEQIQALRKSQRADMQAQRETGERPTQEEMEGIREQHRAAVAEILTDEQFAQLEQLRADRPEGQGVRGHRSGMRGQRGSAEDPFATLELSDVQKEQLQVLRESQRADMQAQREIGERPTQEEMEVIREQHRAAVAEILTDEQLEQLRANQPRWNGSEDEEAATPAAKPAGAAIESSSWGSIKAQLQ